MDVSWHSGLGQRTSSTVVFDFDGIRTKVEEISSDWIRA
jgi:hypothetical protein